jgi:CBS domain-containing protein
MKCPFCGYDNIAGEDSCESCGEDLASLDITVEPQSELEAHLINDLIAKIPPPQAVCVSRNTSLYDVAKKMNEKKIGCVLVMEKKALVGIVSERDILYKAFRRRDKDPSQIMVESVMTPSPETLNHDDTLAYALNRMSLGGYRHIPILKNKEVVGLVSVQNIFKYITKHLQAEAE